MGIQSDTISVVRGQVFRLKISCYCCCDEWRSWDMGMDEVIGETSSLGAFLKCWFPCFV